MPLDPAQHVQRSASIPAELDLTPQDYFVLSRVEQPITVADLVRSCGLPSSEASAIVNKLVEGGALSPCQGRPKPTIRPPTGSHASLRAAAQDRKRQALAAALQGSRVAVEPRNVQPSVPSRQVVEPEREPDREDSEQSEKIDRRQVSDDDPRLDPDCPISMERQLWILAMADHHEQMSQFEILGILPTHDIKAIKRAYHDTSRALHPDAYHGRNLGAFRPILSTLFREAKVAYGELRREDVRAPWVDRRIEDDARARLKEEAQAAEARKAREAAAARRREERTRARAERQRDALRTKMQASASSMLDEAEAAEKAGNLAKAANLYLLATRADPDNAALQQKWDAVRRAAREKRGTEAYIRAQQRLDIGQVSEALPWLLEAADALPTAEHLAHAAFMVREGDPNAARDLAMRALEALRTTEATGKKLRSADASRLHIWIGYAFLAAGQVSTAKAQADAANQLRPDDPDVRALLKACKAK